MKRILIIGGLILAVVLMLVFFVYATGQDKENPQTPTETVQKAEKHECGNCPANCSDDQCTAECKDQCSAECKGECTECDPAKCKEMHANDECTGHKPGECQKK